MTIPALNSNTPSSSVSPVPTIIPSPSVSQEHPDSHCEEFEVNETDSEQNFESKQQELFRIRQKIESNNRSKLRFYKVLNKVPNRKLSLTLLIGQIFPPGSVLTWFAILLLFCLIGITTFPLFRFMSAPTLSSCEITNLSTNVMFTTGFFLTVAIVSIFIIRAKRIGEYFSLLQNGRVALGFFVQSVSKGYHRSFMENKKEVFRIVFAFRGADDLLYQTIIHTTYHALFSNITHVMVFFDPDSPDRNMVFENLQAEIQYNFENELFSQRHITLFCILITLSPIIFGLFWIFLFRFVLI